MVSEKQLAANRENARKSTGPKSEETKKIVSQNALRHGLTGQVTRMPDEDRTAHDNFCAAIVADLAPEGALETQLAQAIAEDNWRMNRGRAVETNLFAVGAFYPPGPIVDTGNNQIDDALRAVQVFAADPKQFQLLSLYTQRTNRDMEKALNRLPVLKAERKALRQHALEEAAALYRLNEIKGGTPAHSQASALATSSPQPIRSEAANGQDLSPQVVDCKPNAVAVGFVFSTTEIRAFLDRKRRLNELARIENRQNNPHYGKHFQPKRPLSRAA
jgi:hypothetical protein